jgi:hypothetical protein
VDDQLLEICDEFGVISQLIDASYLAATSSCLKNTSPIATLIDVVSERLKKARAELDQYYVRHKRPNQE